MTEPASVSGRIAKLTVDYSRHTKYVTEDVTRGNVENCFIVSSTTNVPSRSNRFCKKGLVKGFACERKGSNKIFTPREDSSEESRKEMDHRTESGIDMPFYCCERLQLPASVTNQICCQTDIEKSPDSGGRDTRGFKKTFSSFLRYLNLSDTDSSSETLTLKDGDSSPASDLQGRDVRSCESCRGSLRRGWLDKNAHSDLKHDGFGRQRESIPMSTDFRYFSSRHESPFSLDGYLQEEGLDKWQRLRTSFSLCNKRTRSNKSLQANGNYRKQSLSKLDLSKVKVTRLRKKRKVSKTPLHSISSWIITFVGCFLHCCRNLACSATYRKSNVFTRNCITFALWTLVILPGDSKRVLGNSLLISPGQFCMRARNLNARQQEICENHSHILKHVEDGVILGSQRCQREFQYNRWNCSTLPRSFYGRLLIQDVRETAYVTAVTSAAVTYAVTYACSKGEIEDCGCAEKSVNSYDLLKAEARKRNIEVSETQLRRAAATFEWGGCSDVVEYGERISEIFTNHFGRRFQGKDLKGKIEEHNLEAGRLAITNYMRRECRCHGLTGSCTLKTCWEKMPKWQDVGVRIRDQFDKAIRVQLANDGSELLPTRKQRLAIKEYPFPRQPYPDLSLSRRMKRASPGIYSRTNSRRSDGESTVETGRRRRKRKRYKNMRKRRGGDRSTVVEDENLVYSQESPNFCRRVRKHGTLGTSGRRCIPNATGAGSCDYMCCGRSYTQHQVTVTNKCNCRLEYCCKVICDECTTQETIYTCD